MKKHDHAAAAPGRGYEWRAVGKRRPCALDEKAVGLGQHLTLHDHVVRYVEIVERSFAREAAELLRLLPGQRAAKRAAAAAQPDRYETVVGSGKARPGEANKHAAVIDPFDEAVACGLGEVTDVRQSDHRQALIDKPLDCGGRRRALGEAYVGERTKRAREIISGSEKRLRRIGRCAGHDANGATPPSFVEELDRAGGTFAGDFQSRDVVSDFDREIEFRFGLQRAAGEVERRVAERKAAQIARAHDALCGRRRFGAHHADGQACRRVVRAGNCERPGNAAAHCEDTFGRELIERRDELAAVAEIDSVGEPDHRCVRNRSQQASQRCDQIVAIRSVRGRRSRRSTSRASTGRKQRGFFRR